MYAGIIELLLSVPEFDINDDYGTETSLDTAIKGGHADLVRTILADPKFNGQSPNTDPLELAAEGGNIDIVRMILEDDRIYIDRDAVVEMAEGSGYDEIADLVRNYADRRSLR